MEAPTCGPPWSSERTACPSRAGTEIPYELYSDLIDAHLFETRTHDAFTFYLAMIVITGTKRSGTSMWMQILQAGGIQVIGSPFGQNWEKTIKDANKRGFYESPLRRGIYYQTNPHPKTGTWLHPKATAKVGVKVFIPGVIRSDVIYLGRVIASVRPFRAYTASLRRLYEMEAASIAELREQEGKPARPPTPHLDATLEWWLENFLLIRDVVTRGYPARFVAYESVLSNPEGVLSEIFAWLQAGDMEKAAEAVHPEDSTQKDAATPDIDHPCADVFDDYYDRVLSGRGFDESFLTRMNETHLTLLPEIERQLHQLSMAQRTHAQRTRAQRTQRQKGEEGPNPNRPNPLNVDRLDYLLHPEPGK